MGRTSVLASKPRARACLIVLASFAALGVVCQPEGPWSEQGYFRLDEHGLFTRTGYLVDPWVGEPVLVGESTCPALRCLQRACDEQAELDGGVTPCFGQTVTGASFAEGCLTFDAPGEVVWALEPIACQPPPDAGAPLEADRFVFRAIAAPDVLAQEQPGIERLAAGFVDAGSLVVEPALPDGFAAPRDELRVVEGGQAPVTVTLRAVEDGSLVAVGGGPAIEDVTPTPQSVRVQDGWFLEADPGARATLRVVRETASFDAADVEGVPLADAASMSLLAFYWAAPDNPGVRSPAAVHALVRDAAGRPLDGAPVEWTLVQGDVATNSVYANLDAVPNDEQGPIRRGPWLMVADLCRPPSWRASAASALLRARLGTLTSDVRLTWSQVPNRDVENTWLGLPSTSPADDEGFTRDPMCPPFPACGCTSARTGADAPLRGGAALLAAMAVMVARMRRRAA